MIPTGSGIPQQVRPAPNVRGARASNAGDQFHELWALEQTLGLLEPSKGLTALTVEGVAAERTGKTEDEPFWDGVDCALYFGGDALETANRVEFVQLKYHRMCALSSAHAPRALTASVSHRMP